MTAAHAPTPRGLGAARLPLGGSWTRLSAAAAVLVLVALLPLLAADQLDYVVVVGIFFIVVVGLDLFMGRAGQISLGHTVFMAVGGYGSALLTVRAGWPSAAAAATAAAAAGALAYGLGRPLLALRGPYLALATLCLAVVAQGLATDLVDVTGGPAGISGVPPLTIGPVGGSDATGAFYLVALVALAGAALVASLGRSQTGRALEAIAADPGAATLLGIDAAGYRTRAFVLSAVFASVAGSLYASYLQFFAPDLVSVLVAFNLVIMLAVGGSRSVIGPLLGVLLLQGLPRLGQSVALYEPLIGGVLLMVAVTCLPTGLWGAVRTAVARRCR